MCALSITYAHVLSYMSICTSIIHWCNISFCVVCPFVNNNNNIPSRTYYFEYTGKMGGTVDVITTLNSLQQLHGYVPFWNCVSEGSVSISTVLFVASLHGPHLIH